MLGCHATMKKRQYYQGSSLGNPRFIEFSSSRQRTHHPHFFLLFFSLWKQLLRGEIGVRDRRNGRSSLHQHNLRLVVCTFPCHLLFNQGLKVSDKCRGTSCKVEGRKGKNLDGRKSQDNLVSTSFSEGLNCHVDCWLCAVPRKQEIWGGSSLFPTPSSTSSTLAGLFFSFFFLKKGVV